MGLLEFFTNLKIHPYKYIEKCPNCGSWMTGRYVREPLTETDMEYIERESLKHGEIVRFAPREPIKNAFCVECDHRWAYTPRTIYLSREEMEEEIERRGTEPAYKELKKEISNKELIYGKNKKSLF